MSFPEKERGQTYSAQSPTPPAADCDMEKAHELAADAVQTCQCRFCIVARCFKAQAEALEQARSALEFYGSYERAWNTPVKTPDGATFTSAIHHDQGKLANAALARIAVLTGK